MPLLQKAPVCLACSSTTPVSHPSISSAHLFGVFPMEREVTSNPCTLGQVYGKPFFFFFPCRKSGSLCEAKQFAVIREQAAEQKAEISGQSFSRESLQATDPLWCCSWFTVSPGTSVCASALVRVNSNQAIFCSIHKLFLGLCLQLTRCRSSRSAHASQHMHGMHASQPWSCRK